MGETVSTNVYFMLTWNVEIGQIFKRKRDSSGEYCVHAIRTSHRTGLAVMQPKAPLGAILKGGGKMATNLAGTTQRYWYIQ